MIFSGKTKYNKTQKVVAEVADWQDVGVEKSTPLSLSNCDRTARNVSNFEDGRPIVL